MYILKKPYIFLFVLWTLACVWLFLNLRTDSTLINQSQSVCILKSATGIPCPACGTTRSIDALISGNFTSAWLLNPFGYIGFALMLIVPVWFVYDSITQSKSFPKAFKKFEQLLKTNYIITIILIAIVLANWIWNIQKGI